MMNVSVGVAIHGYMRRYQGRHISPHVPLEIDVRDPPCHRLYGNTPYVCCRVMWVYIERYIYIPLEIDVLPGLRVTWRYM